MPTRSLADETCTVDDVSDSLVARSGWMSPRLDASNAALGGGMRDGWHILRNVRRVAQELEV
jgi:hypothetical protein